MWRSRALAGCFRKEDLDIKENGQGTGEENKGQWKQALRERLMTEYSEYMKKLHEKTPEELIGQAEDIAAVKLMYEDLITDEMYEIIGCIIRTATAPSSLIMYSGTWKIKASVHRIIPRLASRRRKQDSRGWSCVKENLPHHQGTAGGGVY